MASGTGEVTHGFTQVDQTTDPRFFIEFLDARKTIEGEARPSNRFSARLSLLCTRRAYQLHFAPSSTEPLAV